MVEDDGTVWLKDNNSGERFPEGIESQVKRQSADSIRDALQRGCEHWNNGIIQLLDLHLTTPPPNVTVAHVPEEFSKPLPVPPVRKGAGFLGLLSRSYKEKVSARNDAIWQSYLESLRVWQDEKAKFEAAQSLRRRFIEYERLANPSAMQEYLHEVLSGLQWPRETSISFQVQDDGKAVLVDVDLPEIEDMPTQQASVAVRELRILVKDKSDTQRRREYATHVHGVLFRVIGDVFAALPAIHEVICSGYSQRPSKATGQVVEEYLVSVKVFRGQWSCIDFKNLKCVDPAVALAAFEMRRKMTATGIFSPIEPFCEEDL